MLYGQALIEWADLHGHASDSEVFDPNWDEEDLEEEMLDEEDKLEEDEDYPTQYPRFYNIQINLSDKTEDIIYKREDGTFFQLHRDHETGIEMTTDLGQISEFVSWY